MDGQICGRIVSKLVTLQILIPGTVLLATVVDDLDIGYVHRQAPVCMRIGVGVLQVNIPDTQLLPLFGVFESIRSFALHHGCGSLGHAMRERWPSMETSNNAGLHSSQLYPRPYSRSCRAPPRVTY